MLDKISKENDPTAIRARMIKIVTDCRDEYDGDLGGELFVGKDIPEDQAKAAVSLFSASQLDVGNIDENEIVAIFLSNVKEQYKCFSILLFTIHGFYFDVGGKEGKPGFVRWDTLWAVRRRINRSNNVRKEIKLRFHGGEGECSIYMPAVYVHSLNHFLLPVLNRLKLIIRKQIK